MQRRIAILGFLAASGVALGLIGARYVFVNSGLSLIPWGLVSLGIGVVSTTTKRVIVDAALFGFVLATSFMMFDYDGNEGVVAVIGPFCLLGLVGSCCAVVLAVLGRAIRARVSR